VDFSVLPDEVDARLIAGFTLNVQIVPNGQRVTEAQVVLEFDSSRLRFVDARLDDNSLLRTPLVDGELRGDNIVLAAKETSNPPNSTFNLGSVSFEVLPVSDETDVTVVASGALRTYASYLGEEVTRDLEGATVTIGMFTFP
jgi:hypothetical protein